MAGWPSFSGVNVGIARGVGGGNSFWRSLSLNIWRSHGFYRQAKLLVLAYAAANSEALASKGRHLQDDILYYDAFMVQTFVGTERVAQH